MRERSERGAVAVEFALLAPVLILLLFGITEFGRAYNIQLTLSSAAREGVRVMAIANDASAARTAVKNSAVGLQPALGDADIIISPSSCVTNTQVTVVVNHSLSTMTGIAGPFALQGKGVMLCGG